MPLLHPPAHREALTKSPRPSEAQTEAQTEEQRVLSATRISHTLTLPTITTLRGAIYTQLPLFSTGHSIV